MAMSAFGSALGPNTGVGDPKRAGGRKRPPKQATGLQQDGSSNGNGHNRGVRRNDRPNADRKRASKRPDLKAGPATVLREATETPDPLDKPTRVLPRQSDDKLQSYEETDVQIAGPLFANPEQLGFSRKAHAAYRLRPVPRYLLSQPRQLVTPVFAPNSWDTANQQKMLTMEQAGNGSDFQGLYELFQKMREVERKQMEQLGLVDAENISKDLNDAIAFQGSCLDMCPIFERVRRALENNVKALEKDPVTNKISRLRAVKAFSRPAAGQPPPLPSEVRPPHILTQSLDFLVDTVLPQLPEAHSFLWDRTRSIRQDFTYQNFFGPEAIDCNEKIVRIHLLCLHVMAGSDVEYSQQQELEQFNKALQTLVEIYQDIRNHGGRAPNEAEFRAYHLLSHLRDPELEREIQALPDDVLMDRHVQLALRIRGIISQNNIVERGYTNSIGALNLFVEFFRTVYSEETPFLMACLLETHFNEIRFYALKSMSRCYHTKGKPYVAESLRELLGFDSIEKLLKFVSYYEIDTLNDNGVVLVDLFNKEKLESKYKLHSFNEKPKLSKTYSSQIDQKLQGRDLKSFVNSGRPNTDLQLKNVRPQKPVSTRAVPFAAPSASTQPPISNGFGAPKNESTKSLNLSDFLKSKAASNQTPAPTPTFAFSNNAHSAPPVQKPALPAAVPPAATSNEAKPSFSFTPPVSSKLGFSSETKSKPNPQPAEHKPMFQTKNEAKGLFNFGTSKPSIVVHTPETKGAMPLFKPMPKVLSTTTSETLGGPPKAEISVSSIALQGSQSPPKKRLVQAANFPQALDEVYQHILTDTVDRELREVLPKLIRKENRKRERTKIIESFASELYQAFLSEVVYKSTLEILADQFRNKKLKTATISKISNKGRQLIVKQETKRKKIGELNLISFKVPTLKRRPSDSSIGSIRSTKRRSVKTDPANESIGERQTEIRKLWEPLDLHKFIQMCSMNIKLPIEAADVQLKFLLAIENWSSPYSKWLNTKLSLRLNKERLIYENHVSDNKLAVRFESLPNSNYLNREFFQNTSFILFECGFFNDEQVTKFPSLPEKLKRDGAVLNKIVQLSARYSYYKVQLLVMFWDTTDAGVSEEEACSLLAIDKHKDGGIVLGITFCDLTSKDNNINDVLIGGFDKVASGFHGELSPRGVKKREKVKKIATINRISSLQLEVPRRASVTEDSVRAKEETALKRARASRKYGYLSQHMAGTPNTSLAADTSSMLFRGRPNTSMQSTFLNLNALGAGNDTTFASERDLSILPSYGVGTGIIEESTPASSPTAKSFARPDARNAPKNLVQLRSLAASIKARYKR